MTGVSAPANFTASGSLGNQMFINFTSDGSGVGKGFSAQITFGNVKLP